ncbi:MAG: hypothetical protein ACE5HP_11905 [Gemmatimonadota bacterium]
MPKSKLFPLVVAAYCLGCGEAPEAEEYPDAVTADPDHYSVEFENDAVRLVRIAYGPGEQSVMHEHPASCAVALGEASWRMTDPDGVVTEDAAALGDVDCFEATVHLPENTGADRGELVLIEFKEGAAPGSAAPPEYPDAVTADPDHYSVDFENDVARLVRIRYGAGETSVMHHHPANCAVFLHDQPVTFELPTGEVVEAPAATSGQVVCSDAEVHLPTNVGEEPLELVLLELKGRETLQD